MKHLATVATVLATITTAHAETVIGPSGHVIVPSSPNNNNNNNNMKGGDTNLTIIIPQQRMDPAIRGPMWTPEPYVPAPQPPAEYAQPLQPPGYAPPSGPPPGPPPACRTGIVRGLYTNVPPGAAVNLAVRTGPGAAFPAIATLTEGWFVEVCERQGNWFRVRSCRGPWSPLAGGRCDGGWASRRFIVPAT